MATGITNVLSDRNRGNILMKFVSILIGLSLLCHMLCANPFFSVNPETQDIQETTVPAYSVQSVRSGAVSATAAQNQKTLREKIADLLYNVHDNPSENKKTSLYFNLFFISFLYGIFHAAGPGHRKTIVFSLYLGKKAFGWEPALTSILLALLHGGCAVVLILLFKSVEGSLAQKIEGFAVYMEGFSYMLLFGLALYILVHETIEFVTFKTKGAEQHVPSYVIFLLSGLYPCPGAVLILILSNSLNIISLGIYSIVAMSLGMTIPIALAGYLAWFGRKGLFHLIKTKEYTFRAVSYGLSVTGAVFLIFFSIYVSYPFFVSLITR